jgi:hypothetical protein
MAPKEGGRDGPIVAWHEVPGTAPPQKNRPVGHGMIGRRPGGCRLTPMGADCERRSGYQMT